MMNIIVVFTAVFVVKVKLIIMLAILLVHEIQESGNLFCLYYSVYVRKYQLIFPEPIPAPGPHLCVILVPAITATASPLSYRDC